MKALVCESLGPPSALKIMQLDPPRAGVGEAVVAVEYAALNFMDTLVIEGKYQ